MRIKAFFLFPLFLLSLSLSAQNYSTRGEVFDFEIGDEFHFSEGGSYYGGGGSGGHSTWYNIEVTDKYYSANLDTVHYQRFVETLTSSSEVPEWVYECHYDWLAYTDLNSIFPADSILYGPDYNGRKMSWDYVHDPPNFQHDNIWVDGCGKVHRYWYQNDPPNFTSEFTYNLVYFKKGSEEWGTPHIIVGTEELDEYLNTITLFPNPAGDRIQLSVDNNVVIEEMRMFDQMGKMILTVSSNYKNIDVSDLNPGLYVVEIITEQGRVCRKLVVE